MNGPSGCTPSLRARGFTLIELMVVVAIVGILASIAIPSYQDYTIRARVTEGLTAASLLKATIADYFLANNAFPIDNLQAGMAAPGDYASAQLQSITIGAGGRIDVAFNAIGTAVAAGALIRFVPTGTAAGGVTWDCASGSTLPARYRPASCR